MDGVLSIQTKFEYNRDGEAHMMHYYQDMTTNYKTSWRCVSRLDLGVESVPLLGTRLTDPEIETMSYEEFSNLETYDPNGHEIIDLSDIENIPDNTFIHWMLSDGLVGVFEQEIECDGDLPTMDEVSLALNRYGVFPEEQVCNDVNEDGDMIYSGYCNFEYNEYFQYNGAYCFRVKDGKAQGAFSMFRDDADSGYIIGILPYMVQGIRFVQ